MAESVLAKATGRIGAEAGEGAAAVQEGNGFYQ